MKRARLKPARELEAAAAAGALVNELVRELVAALEGWRACQGAVRTAMPDPPVVARARNYLAKAAIPRYERRSPTNPSP